MTVDYFLQKFKSKSDLELYEITHNNIKYIIEARIAALKILKNRKLNCQQSQNIIDKLQELEKILNFQIQTNQNISDETNKKLRKIEINKSLKIKLENKNELQIERLSNKIFQIRIEHYKSALAPVVICFLNDNGEKDFFPFFYLKSILFSVILAFILVLYSYFTEEKISDDILDFIIWLLIAAPIFQIFLTPFSYPIILKTFNEEIKNIS